MLSFRIRKSSFSSSGVPTASEIPSILRFDLLLYCSSLSFCSSRDTTLFSRSVILFSFCSISLYNCSIFAVSKSSLSESSCGYKLFSQSFKNIMV